MIEILSSVAGSEAANGRQKDLEQNSMGEAPMPCAGRRRLIVLCASLVIAMSLIGCGTYQGTGGIPGSPMDRIPTVTLNVWPKQAVTQVQKAIAAPPLSLRIDSVQDGVIVTGWKEYPGEIHIVRRWPERTRFYIVVNPDFDDATNKSRVVVYDQTQEKADERQGWVDNPHLYRRDRADAVLQAIK